MDNTDRRGKSGINNCMFIYATTSTFFEDRSGIKTYDALYQRVKDELKTQLRPRHKNQRATVIDLEQDPLNLDALNELAQKIRMVHSIAYEWKADQKVPNDLLKDYVKYIYETNITTNMSDLEFW